MKRLSYHLVFLTFLFASIHILLFWRYGHRNFVDAQHYLDAADFFVRNRSFVDTHYIFYGIPVLLIALFRWISPGEVIPFLLFQSMVSYAAMLVLYRASSKIFQTNWAGFFAGVIFTLWLDQIHWNLTVMTESLFCSLICFLIGLLAQYQASRKDHLLLMVLLSMMFLTRPTSVIVISAAIIFLLKFHWAALSSTPMRKWSILFFLFASAALVCYGMFSQWDFSDQYHRGNIITYADVVPGDPPYKNALRMDVDNLVVANTHMHPLHKMLFFIYHNPVHFFKAAVMKLWYLMSGLRPYYTATHNLYTLGWMLFIYTTAFFGWRNSPGAAIKPFILSVVILNALLIAISSVDWDNRFYIPMLPGIVLLAGGGCTHLLRRFHVLEST